jgi:hypothetical protein
MTAFAVFDVIGPNSPSARIRKRGAVTRRPLDQLDGLDRGKRHSDFCIVVP